MFVPFEKLPDTARIWIYQSDRKLTDEDKNTISSKLSTFTTQWTAHNQTLGASFYIFHDFFIVLAVDEDVNQASGCSIDASVHAFRDIASKVGIDVFARTNVAFLVKGEVVIIPQSGLLKKLEEGIWTSETSIFNTSIVTKGELTDKWIIPAGKSWLKRYLDKVSISGSN